MSLQAPLFPTEAEKKGATASEYGFANGASSLAALVVSPFGGLMAQKIGAKWLYAGSALAQALAGLCFGFIAVAYFLRIVIGVTDSFAWISVVSILMALF